MGKKYTSQIKGWNFSRHIESFSKEVYTWYQGAEVGDTNFWVLESESGIMPMSKRIRYWIRDSEKNLTETESETETKKKP